MKQFSSFALVLSATAVLALVAALGCRSDAEDEPAAGQSEKTAVAETGAANPNAYERALAVTLDKVPARDSDGLHNVFVLSPNIVSGSEPHGEPAIAEIAAMGVKTILSVDGKVPDAEMAARHGMRYVHIPIEYSGMSDTELLEIAKTFRETEGPFYVHCFHGKHRGPAAAAIGRIVLDGAPREQTLAEMRQWCGTAKKYYGLYRTVAECTVPSAEKTAAYDFDFPAARKIEGFRALMVQTPRAHDHLKDLQKRGWEADPAHPDVDAYNEAEKLHQLFSFGETLDEVREEKADFRGWMSDSTKASADLVSALGAIRQGDRRAEVIDRANEALGRITASCTACHAVYRD
ncbi:MAG: hypothetical protein R3F20_00730 [Planctomycetota bacterium]